VTFNEQTKLHIKLQLRQYIVF